MSVLEYVIISIAGATILVTSTILIVKRIKLKKNKK